LKLRRDQVGLSRVQHGLHLFQGVAQPGGELCVATELLDHLEAVGTRPALLVDVGDAAEEGAEDDLGVVLEEVNLKEETIMISLF
jgi:hypothetical protein